MWRHFTQESSASKNPERLLKDYSSLLDRFTMPKQKQKKPFKKYSQISANVTTRDTKHNTVITNFQIGLRL